MTLFLTDSTALVRLLRARLRGDPTSVVETLPRRIVASAAATGVAVEHHRPTSVVIATPIANDESERLGVVYRVAVAGESWMPDVLVAHGEEALTLTAGETASAGAALGAAISLMGPGHALMLAGGSGAFERMADRCVALADALARIAERSTLMSKGADHVGEAVRLGDAIAERLRLTRTQRARFLQAVRSAAVRGEGEVPTPLADDDGARAVNKEQAKRRLASLEQQLAEWKRAEL